MMPGFKNIVIANTNTSAKEWKPYTDLAEKYGYQTHFIIVENRHRGVSEHNVPVETLEKMEDRIIQDLKLK